MATTQLFPASLSPGVWQVFQASGYDTPVVGTVWTERRPAANGMPLGGLDTGCIDLETNGLWGYVTAFNSLAPRRGPLNVPALGFTAGRTAYVCSAEGIPGVAPAKTIRYWGHYPVADIEFGFEGPVQAGLRAWSPFLPGDLKESMLPAAVLELKLRNRSAHAVSGCAALSFPGPEHSEVRYTEFVRETVFDDRQKGVEARGGQNAQYSITVLGARSARMEPFYGWDPDLWRGMGRNAPPLLVNNDEGGLAVSTRYSIPAGGTVSIRFLLAWHAPVWFSNGVPSAGGTHYRHMYAKHWPDLKSVRDWVAEHHADLLGRIVRWQSEVYKDGSLPPYLKDGLVNSLHLITECGVWAQSQDELGTWCKPEDGLFAMNEAPRCCPQLSCTPCNMYGDLPLSYFFPEAALSTLRAYKHYQYPSGAAPFIFGGVCNGTGPYDLVTPTQGYQWALDGACVLDMVDKAWRVAGDEKVLDEFYDMCKRLTEFTMTQRPKYGDRQVVSMPEGDVTQDWFEFAPFYGLASHLGGVRLAQLGLMERMARAKGDESYAETCRRRMMIGEECLNKELWRGTHYGMYFEPETGKRSDMVMAYQLDGEWLARLHGVDPVFPPDRVHTTLATVYRINADEAANPHGAAVFAYADGRRPTDAETGYWTGWGSHAPGNLMLAMTDLYEGDRDRGLRMIKRTLRTQVLDMRAPWDMAILYRTDTGRRMYGNDYYQNLVIWAVPAALAGRDLTAPCLPGGLVSRILEAAKSGARPAAKRSAATERGGP